MAAPQGAIPEGTVLGDGHIKIGLTRIDTRLLHGQVATTWTKMVNPDRIIVVSDAVSKDDLRKRMIIEAAPPGVKAHVIPIWEDDRYQKIQDSAVKQKQCFCLNTSGCIKSNRRWS